MITHTHTYMSTLWVSSQLFHKHKLYISTLHPAILRVNILYHIDLIIKTKILTLGQCSSTDLDPISPVFLQVIFRYIIAFSQPADTCHLKFLNAPNLKMLLH